MPESDQASAGLEVTSGDPASSPSRSDEEQIIETDDHHHSSGYDISEPPGQEQEQTEAAPTIRSIMTPERRRRLIWGLLFHRVLHGRSRRRRNHGRRALRRLSTHRSSSSSDSDESLSDSDWSAESLGSSSRPPRPIHVLPFEQAVDLGSICRFCFDGALPDEEEEAIEAVSSCRATESDGLSNRSICSNQVVYDQNPLISPCNCTGGSEFVHVNCLRQWQASDRHSASRCQVCLSPLAVRPPRFDHSAVKRGSLLVFKEDLVGPTRSFYHSLVLLLHVDASRRPMGVIVNHLNPSHASQRLQAHFSASQNVEWFQGGPVCGGRLGIVKYLVAYTTENEGTVAASNGSTAEASNNDDGPPFASRSVRILEDQQLFFLTEDESLHSEPAKLSEAEAQSYIQTLQASNIVKRILVYCGYCQWGRGQLPEEIQRQSWDICTDGLVVNDMIPTPASQISASVDDQDDIGRHVWDRVRNNPQCLRSASDLVVYGDWRDALPTLTENSGCNNEIEEPSDVMEPDLGQSEIENSVNSGHPSPSC